MRGLLVWENLFIAITAIPLSLINEQKALWNRPFLLNPYCCKDTMYESTDQREISDEHTVWSTEHSMTLSQWVRREKSVHQAEEQTKQKRVYAYTLSQTTKGHKQNHVTSLCLRFPGYKRVKIKKLSPYIDHKPAKGTVKFGASLKIEMLQYSPIISLSSNPYSPTHMAYTGPCWSCRGSKSHCLAEPLDGARS